MRSNNSKRVGPRVKLAALGASCVAALSSAAIAGTVYVTITFASSTGVNGLKTFLVTIPGTAAALLSTTSSSTRPVMLGSSVTNASVPSPTVPSATPTPTSSKTSSTAETKAQYGVNLAPPDYATGGRPFVNLLAGSGWQHVSTTNKYTQMTGSLLNIDREVPSLSVGEKIARVIQAPLAAVAGKSVDVKCTWLGSGKVALSSWIVKNPNYKSNSVKFTFVPNGSQGAVFYIKETDPSNPIRGLDCREADADPTAIFTKDYIDTIKRYSVVRFMDWQSTNKNNAVNWATRTKPGSGVVRGDDGVALEYMVDLANETGVDPWFCMPWNADDDYIRRFATYVRDNLNPGRKIYVETSNEVWNWGFKVTHQARDEGKAAGLSQVDGSAVLYRYVQKSIAVLDIWADVFAGQPDRLVRVLATQNDSPIVSEKILPYLDAWKHVDALATAPYFAWNLNNNPIAEKGIAAFVTTTLPDRMDDVLAKAARHKANAAKYGLRFIAYEGGQHVVGADVPLLQKIERDPRMGALYTRYLTKWRDEIGDLMTLYSDVGPISKYGAWGMQEYAGQPASEAPKFAAVSNFLSGIGQ